jgi:hypothetical protein
MNQTLTKWITVLALIAAFDAHAQIEDDVSVQLAKGVQFTDGSALFLGYQPNNFEYHFSTWDGDSSNTAVGIGYPLSTKLGISWTPGMAMLSNQNEILGTNWQFYNHFRFRYHDDRRMKLDIGWLHYSNGSRILNHRYGPNMGENFLTMSLRYDF